MKHISLFSGIGGFDLAAEWMGWENVAHCEWNPFGQKVLKYYWPNAISYHDITKTDFTIHRGNIDIITGGFPCQPYSLAGQRKGKEDERHLWPEMLRAIREIQPCWVVGENVRGLINWSGGLVFDEVQADLENEGYEVTPFLLPACAVDAPHRRDRVWFVAYSGSKRCNNGSDNRKERQVYNNKNRNAQEDKPKRNGWKCRISEVRKVGNVANTDSAMRERRPSGGQAKKRSEPAKEQFRGCDKFYRTDWSKFPTQSPLCDGDDGLSARLDGITFPKWRNESIKAGGNAIVPQVAHQIFKAIQQYESL